MHSIEQQIYASLAIDGLKAGHHTHAHTPGLSQSARERHEEICNRWGSYEPGAEFRRGLVQVPLWLDAPQPAAPSHHMVALITYQGRDAGGRPGAMLRHVLRIPADVYKEAQFNPFQLLRHGYLLEQWTPVTVLPEIPRLDHPTTVADLKGIFPERYPRLRRLLGHALARRLRLPTSSDSPAAEETLGHVFELVPVSSRRRMSLATFAYKHPEDFEVAAIRQEDTTFRASLASLEEAPPVELGDAYREYIDNLFKALENGEFTQALALIRETQLPDLEHAVPAHRLSTAEPVDAPDPGSDESDEFAKAMAERRKGGPPPALPYERFSAKAPPSRSPWRFWWIGLLLVGAAAVFALRGRESPTTAVQHGQLAEIEATDFLTYLQRHEAELSEILNAGGRDFDLEENATAARTSFEARARAALAGESARIDRLVAQVDANEWSSWAAQQSELVQTAAAHGQQLRDMIEGASAAAFRANYDVEQQAFRLSTPDPDTTLTWEPASLYAEALGEWSEGLRALDDASSERSAESWDRAASSLQRAVDAFGDMVPPRSVSATAALAHGMADLLRQEESFDWKKSAAALPYDGRSVAGDGRADLVQRLRAAQGDLESMGGPAPVPVAQVLEFYAGAAKANSLDPAQARALCQTHDLCQVENYRLHVDRWWVEACLRQSGDAQSLVATGATLEEATQIMAAKALLGLMQASPVPAAPDLVRRVRASLPSWGNGVTADVGRRWLDRNVSGARVERNSFNDAYGDLKVSLAALRGANAQAASAAWAELQRAASRLAKLDLDQSNDPDRVEVVRDILERIDQPVAVGVENIEVHLLVGHDYSGQKRSVARLVVQFATGQGKSLLEVQAPPILAAGGAGFSPATIPVAGTVQLGARTSLLVTAREGKDGAPWWHFRVPAPAQGHVGFALDASRDIKISAERALAAAAPGAILPASSGGDLVARVHVHLSSRWWESALADWPTLP